MFNKSVIAAAAMLALSAGTASAATYHITLSGACDTVTLTNTGGVVVGVSNAPNSCDDGNLVGVQAKVLHGTNTGKALVVGGTLGTADVWTWYFNLATKTGTLTGTSDGSTVLGPLNFAFTYTGPGVQKNAGLPSAVSLAKKQ